MSNWFDSIKVYPDFILNDDATEDTPLETESYEQLMTNVPESIETLVNAATMYCSWTERYEVLVAIVHRMNCLLMVMDEEAEAQQNGVIR
jgi:hypothetical protein